MRIDAARQFEIIEDDNGYITAEGVIASAGEKLQYGDKTETIGESALFSNMQEWEGLPVTLQHPRGGLLDTSTTQAHQVGSVIKVERRGDELWAKFKVTSKKAINAVKSGLRGLSAGYRTTIDGGTQIARSNNHLALCSVGRSPSSGIRRDSEEIGDKKMAVIKLANGKQVKLDCSDAEETLVQSHIDELNSRADSAESKYNNLCNLISLIKMDKEEYKEEFEEEEEEEEAVDMGSAESKIKKIKKCIEKSKVDKKKIGELEGKLSVAKKEIGKSKEKMDSAINEILADYDLAKKVKSDIILKNHTGETKTSTELFSEALQSKDKDIKLDSLSSDVMRGMLTVHAEIQQMAGQRGTRTDSQSKVITFAEMQKLAQDKLY